MPKKPKTVVKPASPEALAPEAAPRGDTRGFGHVESWIFDLDNTLYPAGSPVWPQIDARITAFIAGMFGVDGLSARALQKYYYQRYGTTLRGLMIEHDLDPQIFLDFAHDIDRSALAADEALAISISKLPGRRFILTSGSHGHAMKTTAHLKIDHLFDGVFDIAAGDFIPKPDERTYQRFVDRFAHRSGARRDVRGHPAQSRSAASARHDDPSSGAEEIELFTPFVTTPSRFTDALSGADVSPAGCASSGCCLGRGRGELRAASI